MFTFHPLHVHVYILLKSSLIEGEIDFRTIFFSTCKITLDPHKFFSHGLVDLHYIHILSFSSGLRCGQTSTTRPNLAMFSILLILF
jgi:hypothetical protein